MKPFAFPLRRFAGLSREHRQTLVAAAVLLPVTWLALRLFGLARVRGWACLQQEGPPAVHELTRARETAVLVEIASRNGVAGGTCLTRSLLLAWLLRRQGIGSELRIGVRVGRSGFDAHAWIECGGAPINATPETVAAFELLLPAAGRAPA